MSRVQSTTSNEAYARTFGLELYFGMVCLLFVIMGSHGLDVMRTALRRRDKRPYCRPLLRALGDMPEATLAVLLGAIGGAILTYGYQIQSEFSDQVYFYLVLPPIIFYQGYSLKKRNFFRYFHYIFTLGGVGTLIQFFVLVATFFGLDHVFEKRLHWPSDHELTSKDVLLLCSVMTANDEVATLALIRQDRYPKLSAVLFGEGVINDAASILLFRSVVRGSDTTDILLSGINLLVLSTLVGLALGLVFSRFLKVTRSMQEHPTRQSIIIVLGCYLSYATSEVINVPGVLSVFFCGIIFSHHAWHSLSHEAQVGTAIFAHSLSTIAEMYSFVALGFSIHRLEATDYSLRLTVIVLLGLLIARAVVVFGAFGIGRMVCRRKFSMALKDQSVLYLGGTVRGAITWAQALQIESTHKHLLISCSLAVISTTLVLVGGIMAPYLRCVGIGESNTTDIGEIEGVSTSVDLQDRQQLIGHGDGGNETSITLPGLPTRSVSMQSIGDSIILHGWVHRHYAKLDERYLKPIFGGRSRDLNGALSPFSDGRTSPNNNTNNAMSYGSTMSATDPLLLHDARRASPLPRDV